MKKVVRSRARTRSAKREKEKLEALEAEVAILRADLASLRSAYNCHYHPTPNQILYQPGWRWNGYQYVWG